MDNLTYHSRKDDYEFDDDEEFYEDDIYYDTSSEDEVPCICGDVLGGHKRDCRRNPFHRGNVKKLPNSTAYVEVRKQSLWYGAMEKIVALVGPL